MKRWWGSSIEEKSPRSRLVPDYAAKRGEVIVKHNYDAFFQTCLERRLRAKHIRQVLICGVLTNACCETTARSAFMRGFEVYVLKDATSTYTKRMHNAALLNLAYGFAVLMNVNQVMRDFNKKRTA
jgi:nicotinamidase-related amidase